MDWARRFAHMQHHTGQHLLTAVAEERFGWRTRSFHLQDMKSAFGAEASIDSIIGYSFPVAATIGAAWGHDGSGTVVAIIN